ncbi:MAG: M15 family metallopeptidase [Actinomycetota bacterium]
MPRRAQRVIVRRRAVAGVVMVVALVAGVVALRRTEPPAAHEIRGSAAWARVHYGDPDASGFKTRNIVEIEFLGRAMFVHKGAVRHFLRLERLFEARAPDYAAAVVSGVPDDWSYLNRPVRGGTSKSTHAFGIAIDVNALANLLGTAGDMPEEVVSQWEIEGGDWGGDWTRPDPMHFESHLTPDEIRARYRLDGTPKKWYLAELIGG